LVKFKNGKTSIIVDFLDTGTYQNRKRVSVLGQDWLHSTRGKALGKPGSDIVSVGEKAGVYLPFCKKYLVILDGYLYLGDDKLGKKDKIVKTLKEME